MYQYYYDRYSYPVRTVKIGRYAKTAQWAHNEFINLAAEASPLALVLVLSWLGLMLMPLASLLSKTRTEILKDRLALLLGFLGSFLGILAHSLVDSNLHQPPIMILAIIDLAGIIYLLSDFKAGLLKKSSYPVMHPSFLRIFIFLAGSLVALIMTFQAAIFGLTFQARRIPQTEQKLNYLSRLGRLPSGYANLYFQIAINLRNLFFKTENPDFALKAIPYFEFAAHLNPESYEFFYHWARCIYQLAISLRNPQLLIRAEQIGKLSLERSGHYPFTYLLLANIAHLEKDFSKEEKWLNSALETEPYYFLARSLLVDLLIGQGRLDEAKTQLNLLKSQKQELDKIPKTGLNAFQLTLTKITAPEIQTLEAKLAEKYK